MGNHGRARTVGVGGNAYGLTWQNRTDPDCPDCPDNPDNPDPVDQPDYSDYPHTDCPIARAKSQPINLRHISSIPSEYEKLMK